MGARGGAATTSRMAARGASTWRLGAFALAALSAGAAIGQAARAQGDLLDTDFLDDAGAARILLSGSRAIYSATAQHQAVQSWVGPLPPGAQGAMQHPPLMAVLMIPFAAPPPHAGLAVFTALSLVALGAATVLLARLAGAATDRAPALAAAACTAMSLPASWGLALAQVDAFMLLAAVAAIAAWRRGNPGLAGLLLSALLVKPQLVWVAALVLLLGAHWRALAGFAAGAAVWALSGALIAGPSGLHDWIVVAEVNARTETTPMMGLPGVARSLAGFDSAAPFVVSVVLGVLVLAAAWRWRAWLRARPLEGVALGLAVALAVSPHVWSHDLVLLAVPLLLVTDGVPRLALVAAAALDVAYLADSPLPRPNAPFQTLAVLGTVAAVVVTLRAARRRSA